MDICDTCSYYTYDEEAEGWFCDVDLDEDDMYHFMTGRKKECPYYQNDNEYAVVRHQA